MTARATLKPGYELKIERAGEHLDVLDNAIQVWLSQGEIRKRIGTLDPGAQALIQGLQPNDGQKFAPNDLWLLDELWNYDKHRRLHLTRWWPDTP